MKNKQKKKDNKKAAVTCGAEVGERWQCSLCTMGRKGKEVIHILWNMDHKIIVTDLNKKNLKL